MSKNLTIKKKREILERLLKRRNSFCGVSYVAETRDKSLQKASGPVSQTESSEHWLHQVHSEEFYCRFNMNLPQKKKLCFYVEALYKDKDVDFHTPPATRKYTIYPYIYIYEILSAHG